MITSKYFQRGFIILSLSMAIMLFGCTNSTPNEPIKKFQLGDFYYEILDKSFSENILPDNTVDTSGYILVINMAITSSYPSVIQFDSSFFKLKDHTGKLYPFSMESLIYFTMSSPSLYSVPLKPQKKVKGFIAFDVPKKDDYQLELHSDPDTKEIITIDLQ